MRFDPHFSREPGRAWSTARCTDSMPLLASWSARSFSGVPGMPSHPVPVGCCARAASRSSSSHRSTFLTGFLSAVFQPRRFHDAIHSLMPFCTYCESVYRSTVAGPLQRLQRADHGGEFHAVVGGLGLAAAEFLLAAVELQQRAPAARTGIALAGAVGVDAHPRRSQPDRSTFGPGSADDCAGSPATRLSPAPPGCASSACTRRMPTHAFHRAHDVDAAGDRPPARRPPSP